MRAQILTVVATVVVGVVGRCRNCVPKDCPCGLSVVADEVAKMPGNELTPEWACAHAKELNTTYIRSRVVAECESPQYMSELQCNLLNTAIPADGRTLKVRTSVEDQDPYQLQVTLDNDGRMYYEASTEDGNPFSDFHRRVIVLDPKPCPNLVCYPGDEHCEEESTVMSCDTEEDIILTVC